MATEEKGMVQKHHIGTKRARRIVASLAAVVALSSLTGCWRDFRKFVTLRYDEHTEVYEWKAEQKKILASYDVVDESAGVYRIPVAAAIEKVAADATLLEPLVEIKTDLSGMSIAQKGEQHFKITYACAACHDLQGNRKVGPALNNRWGKEAPLEGGEVVVFDDEYFRESVYYSRKKIARGYPPAMPVFAESMTEEHFAAIKAYIKTFQ